MHIQIARNLGLGLRRLFAGCALALVASVLVACGGGGGGGDVGGPAPTPTAPRLEIRSDDASPVSSTFVVDFYFSAPVKLPHPSGELQFQLSGASKVANSFTQVSAQLYRVSLTPNVNSQGVVDLRVPPLPFKMPAAAFTTKCPTSFRGLMTPRHPLRS
jgi:hypothetical protein